MWSKTSRKDRLNDFIKISGKLIEGSPAQRCGELKIGDQIIAVNGIDISGMNHGDVVNLIKESGLQVQLTVSNPIVNTNGNSNLTNENYYGNGSCNSYPLTS
jgi:C-terminal processing protease CtpA/Prc